MARQFNNRSSETATHSNGRRGAPSGNETFTVPRNGFTRGEQIVLTFSYIEVDGQMVKAALIGEQGNSRNLTVVTPGHFGDYVFDPEVGTAYECSVMDSKGQRLRATALPTNPNGLPPEVWFVQKQTRVAAIPADLLVEMSNEANTGRTPRPKFIYDGRTGFIERDDIRFVKIGEVNKLLITDNGRTPFARVRIDAPEQAQQLNAAAAPAPVEHPGDYRRVTVRRLERLPNVAVASTYRHVRVVDSVKSIYEVLTSAGAAIVTTAADNAEKVKANAKAIVKYLNGNRHAPFLVRESTAAYVAAVLEAERRALAILSGEVAPEAAAPASKREPAAEGASQSQRNGRRNSRGQGGRQENAPASTKTPAVKTNLGNVFGDILTGLADTVNAAGAKAAAETPPASTEEAPASAAAPEVAQEEAPVAVATEAATEPVVESDGVAALAAELGLGEEQLRDILAKAKMSAEKFRTLGANSQKFYLRNVRTAR